MSIILLPFQSIGEFRFESSISDYSNTYDFIFEPFIKGELPEWDTYEIEKLGIEIYVENDKIVSICCRKSLLYKGVELLGNSIKNICTELEISFNEEDSIYLDEEDIPHSVYEFDIIGIQVWEKDKVIDAIFCSNNQ